MYISIHLHKRPKSLRETLYSVNKEAYIPHYRYIKINPKSTNSLNFVYIHAHIEPSAFK